jgi:hypothetical protein
MHLLSLVGQSYYYNQPYDYDTPEAQAATAGMIIFFILLSLIIAVGVYVLNAIMLGKIFKKAGVESWKAWVPVYNSWVTLELGGQQGWWSILAFIPLVNIVAAVFLYIAMYHVGLKLGKEGAFVLLAIFLPIVWLIWLAVDKSVWNEAAGQASLTPVNPPKEAPKQAS